MKKYELEKLPDKWVTPATLQKLLKKKGKVVSLATINKWVNDGDIPAIELPHPVKKQFLVDQYKIPEVRQRGRPKEK